MAAPAAAMLILLVAIEALLRSAPVLDTVDRHRPLFGEISSRLHVEKQMWHLEAAVRGEAPAPRIVFLGSSSVVNGIDEAIATASLRRTGLPVDAKNFGVTALTANELPSMARYAFSKQVAAVVYLYNGFSFGNEFNQDAIDTRWDSAEMFRLRPSSPLDIPRSVELVDRYFAQRVWTLRFRNLLIDTGLRWVRGELHPLPHPFDYDPDTPVPGDRPRTFADPMPETDWLRRAYLESGRLTDSLGLRGLRRFCDLAREHRVRLIVTPAPEAAFGRYGAWAQGVDFAAIDRRVQRVAERCGAVFRPRDARIEEADALFLDAVHLSREGRNLFSTQIAADVARYLY